MTIGDAECVIMEELKILPTDLVDNIVRSYIGIEYDEPEEYDPFIDVTSCIHLRKYYVTMEIKYIVWSSNGIIRPSFRLIHCRKMSGNHLFLPARSAFPCIAPFHLHTMLRFLSHRYCSKQVCGMATLLDYCITQIPSVPSHCKNYWRSPMWNLVLTNQSRVSWFASDEGWQPCYALDFKNEFLDTTGIGKHVCEPMRKRVLTGSFSYTQRGNKRRIITG